MSIDFVILSLKLKSDIIDNGNVRILNPGYEERHFLSSPSPPPRSHMSRRQRKKEDQGSCGWKKSPPGSRGMVRLHEIFIGCIRVCKEYKGFWGTQDSFTWDGRDGGVSFGRPGREGFWKVFLGAWCWYYDVVGYMVRWVLLMRRLWRGWVMDFMASINWSAFSIRIMFCSYHQEFIFVYEYIFDLFLQPPSIFPSQQ